MVSLLSPVTLTSLRAVEVVTTMVWDHWDNGRFLMGVWYCKMVPQRLLDSSSTL